MKIWLTLALLSASNIFMLLAWYGHLKFKALRGFSHLGLGAIILISWGIALLEYCLMIPANRIGYQGNGGPFSLVQLKVIQEVLHLGLFTLFVIFFFQGETLRWNHALAGLLLIAAVYLVFLPQT